MLLIHMSLQMNSGLDEISQQVAAKIDSFEMSIAQTLMFLPNSRLRLDIIKVEQL